MKTFEKKSFPRMAKDFQKMNEKGTLSFDNAIQRNFVWKNTVKDNRMSMLVDTMLRGFCIPPMYCVQTLNSDGNKCYDFIDGKQRTTTIIKFLNDEFELVGIPTFEDENGNEVDLNGMKYSELPEDYQDAFKTYSLTVYYYEDMCSDDVEEMFIRLNNGKSMSAIELTRVKAKSFDTIKELGGHEVFDDMLTDAGRASYGNEDIVIKSWMMLHITNPSLDTKDVRPIMETAEINEEHKTEMSNIFQAIKSVHEIISEKTEKGSKKIAKRIYTKTHFIAIVPLVKLAMDCGKNETEIVDWLSQFYKGGKGASVSEDYNSTCSGGAMHRESVETRSNELTKSFNKFFNIEEDRKEVE